MSERETESGSPPYPWQTANPWISGVLAYLVPGAGHFYQGRHFKAVLYMVCILGTFFYGTSLADWKAVSAGHPASPGGSRSGSWGFLAQVGVGLPALTAFVQSERYGAELKELAKDHGQLHDFSFDHLDGPLDEPFSGLVTVEGNPDEIGGRIQLKPAVGELGSPIVTGRIIGTNTEGREVDVPVEGRIEIGPRVFGSERRAIRVYTIGPVPALQGFVPRPFLNWYQVPLEKAEEQELHQRLGKTYDLALVYTWIAGLLNLLAIWDCVAGPAYGIGDEPEEDDEPAKSKAEPKPAEPSEKIPASAGTASSPTA